MRMTAVVSRTPLPSFSKRTDRLRCSKTNASCERSARAEEDGGDCYQSCSAIERQQIRRAAILLDMAHILTLEMRRAKSTPRGSLGHRPVSLGMTRGGPQAKTCGPFYLCDVLSFYCSLRI